MSLCCFILYGRNSKCIYKTTKIHHPPPSTLMTSNGRLNSEDIFPFSLLLPPPPPPALCPRYSFLHLVFMEIQIFHPEIFHNVFTVHSESSHFFMRTFIRHANTDYGIRNQCILMGIAVIFTAHTLWRATLFPQRILLKIRADKQKKKKKKSTQRRLTMISRVLISMNNHTTPKSWGGGGGDI